MKIAIIGAGWYGCHIAKSLKNKGLEVKIYEKESDIFLQASSKNQNRLHLGFHYPRSYITRKQSKIGFDRFLNEYGFACCKVQENIYAVDDENSLIDFKTFKQIMTESGLEFEEVDYPFHNYKNLSGFLKTNEMLILFKKVKEYFKNKLKDDIVFDTELTKKDIVFFEKKIQVKNEEFDYLINCTWAKFNPFSNLDFYYEASIVLLYKSKLKNIALTIMDGNFISLYPYNDELYTLTSVKNTPLGRYENLEQAEKRINLINEDEVLNLKYKFEEEILYYYPKFLENFFYTDHYCSVKTKLNVKNDSRECITEIKGREIFIFSGKIDTIFYAEDEVLNFLDLKDK
jgi:hypothetical protein